MPASGLVRRFERPSRSGSSVHSRRQGHLVHFVYATAIEVAPGGRTKGRDAEVGRVSKAHPEGARLGASVDLPTMRASDDADFECGSITPL